MPKRQKIGHIIHHPQFPQLTGKAVFYLGDKFFQIDGTNGEITLVDFMEKLVQRGYIEFEKAELAGQLAEAYDREIL